MFLGRRQLGRFATVAGLFALMLAGVAQAKTFAPTKTGDPNPGRCKPHDCSLREAVRAANRHRGRDKIVLDGGKTYDLTRPGTGEDASKKGDLDIKGRLNISASKGRATIDAHRNDGVIEIRGGSPTTLVRIAVIHGDGGAGQDVKRRLALPHAGGVTSASPLRLVRSVVRNNRGYVAGVQVRGNLTLIRSRISANGSSDSQVGGFMTLGPGGPGKAPNPKLTMVRSRVSKNFASGTGGGYACCIANISRSRIDGNKGAYLGGLELPGRATLKRTRVTGNRASETNAYAGGISSGGRHQAFALIDSVLSNNRTASTSSPGGMWDREGKSLRIVRSTIEGNQGTRGSGVLADDTHVVVIRSRFLRNKATNSYGAGLTLTDTAQNPGDTHDSYEIRGSTFDRNVTSGIFSFGGGIAVLGGTAKISGTTVSRNKTTGTNNNIGGGIYLDSGPYGEPGSLAITNSTIDSNTADYGGGIAGGQTLVTNAVDFTHNKANVEGGGAYFYGTWQVKNSLFAGNAAPAGPNCSSAVSSGGHNLITNVDSCVGFGTSSDLHPTSAKVGKLGNHGGPTQTVPLLEGSPAINKAGNDAPKRDQRGHKRHDPDIGAFERK